MIERARIGQEYDFTPTRGLPVRVRCVGIRRSWAECEGVKDGRHRSCPLKRLSISNA